MGTTQQMARFITNAQYSDIPEPAVYAAKLCILDSIACAIYGTTRPLGKIITELVDEMGGNPQSRVLGTSIKTNAANAALANGTLGHSEDFDDMGSGGHQAVVLMPVAFALAEELGLNGKDVLTSYLVGFDIFANVALNMGPDHYAKGWHSTSSVGTLGSTAVAAKALGLDEMQTRMAIGLGATQASGLRGNFGTMTKPFHPGRASQSGIIAAKMAGKGYESNPDIMEDRFGYAACLGEQMVQLGNMTRHLGYPWAIMGTGKEVANGIDIKIWPCCGGTHGSNTAIIELLNNHSFSSEDVESVDIITTDNPSCMAPNLRWPKSGLQGKFSTWYTVASLIVDKGRLDLESFTDDSANRPELQSMLERVNITQEETIADRPNRAIGGESWWDVTVNLKNGSQLNTRVPGHGDTYGPYTNIQVIDKFQALAGAVISPSQVDTLLNLVMDLENQSDVVQIMDAATLGLAVKA